MVLRACFATARAQPHIDKLTIYPESEGLAEKSTYTFYG